MEIKEAIQHILDGNAVLFVGAGFSKSATRAFDGEKLKDARDLSRDLCKELNITENDNLSKVSNYYLGDKKDAEYSVRAQKLIKKLQDYFICKGVSDSQKTVAQKNWIRIYTTNYDDVLEVAGGPQYDRTPVTMKDKVEDILKIKSVVHLNGYIRNLDKDRLEDDFKLTTRSYLIPNFKESDVSGLFYDDLKEARAVIFIGTSLDYDLELQQMLYSDEYREKIIFIDKEAKPEEIDKVEESTKKQLGTVRYVGLDAFAAELAEAARRYKADSVPVHFRNFVKIERQNYPLKKTNIINTWNLYTSGVLERDILFTHLDDDDYVVRRSVIEEIDSNVKAGHRSINIIHSNLGNGKTCLMEYLMCSLSRKYNVFQFVEAFRDIRKELEVIQSMEGQKIIFIEDYNLYLKMLSALRLYWDESWHLILSCRTYINDHSMYKLCNILKIQEEDVSEFDINGFTDLEKPKIASALRRTNLAEIKDLGDGKILQLLEQKGGNCWADTVMYMFCSKQIEEKVDDVYAKLRKNGNNMEFIIAAMINNIVGMNLSYNQLLMITQIRQQSLFWAHDENAAEILHMQNGKIEIKSSLLSLYLIRSKNLYSDVINVMKKMILNSDRLLGEASNKVKRSLISTSNISELFYKTIPSLQTGPTNIEFRSELLDYFGNICKVKYYKQNEFFWLQYAMACMDMKEYSLAENNFKLAHKYDKEKGVDSYQIKVQYGRFLLQKANDTEETEPFAVFKEANTEWRKVLEHDQAQKYYVYKQMGEYKKFLQRYAVKFTESEHNKARRMVDDMIGLVQKNDRRGARRANREAVNRILEECKEIMLRAIISH